jgi:hypothetical protein
MISSKTILSSWMQRLKHDLSAMYVVGDLRFHSTLIGFSDLNNRAAIYPNRSMLPAPFLFKGYNSSGSTSPAISTLGNPNPFFLDTTILAVF